MELRNTKKIDVFDTTLRDGTQGEHISLSLEDKLRITGELDSLGFDYIEGGWPGSNPKDNLFFKKVKELDLKQATMVAFGCTRRSQFKTAEDPLITSLMEAETPAVSIFGKSWKLHVKKSLRISEKENLKLIADTVQYFKSQGKEVIYDAEHFFDGYKDDSHYALETLKSAARSGADVVVLCDTNGGTLPQEVSPIIQKVAEEIEVPLGVHFHNDSELAVANTLIAVEHGCVQVQGTINGYGERCGNANLCSIIPNLQLKGDYTCIPDDKMPKLFHLSRFVSEVANMHHQDNQPYVGKSAFAHKGGVHVSAVMKDSRTYEHISPEKVGNTQRVLVSELSGRSNVLYKTKTMLPGLKENKEKVKQIVNKLKELEHKGYQFESAESSFELLVKQLTGDLKLDFKLEGFRVTIEKNSTDLPRSEATIRLKVDDFIEHTAAEGVGPVHALDKALRKALMRFYPQIKKLRLIDYKVRDINTTRGTQAKVRVLIETLSDKYRISTVGVSENIIEASWQALIDSYVYYLVKERIKVKESSTYEMV